VSLERSAQAIGLAMELSPRVVGGQEKNKALFGLDVAVSCLR
jgi:hypothetical protein